MDNDQIQAAVSQIRRYKVKVTEWSRINHPGTGAIYRLRCHGDPMEYVLKIYEYGQAREDVIREQMKRETTALWNIHGIDRFRKPAYFGHHDNMLLMEYVEGQLMQHFLQEKAGDTQALESVYQRAVCALAAVHSAISDVADRRRLRSRFTKPAVRRTMGRQTRLIVNEGLPAFIKRGGVVPNAWSKALVNLPVERVADDLAVTGSDYFLSQGDFKPDNLIITKKGDICVLDWQGTAKAQPWYDLAYLLLGVHLATRQYLVELYLKEMQRHGYLQDHSLALAERLLASGAVYQQLARAAANVRFLTTRPDDPHHFNEFSDALAGLARIVPER